ncbi:uncharacterized protein si:dkey-283b1.6 isoform X2 [Onychostoma macrolepis]|uniref:Transmembrane protein 92 n=1 Tax=Onychostoma macrolepis TaxID=369639 RepID=A0A7J6DA01_9TELE|nr:uncharacterized protein si:dkey-283b1.6 isoform X2 [Onychostoma macrolepis]KAF4116042.1 hypothetical protein G5714_003531 [Onychostoma macrolepis]
MERSDSPLLVFKIFIPIITFGFLSICCAGFCKICQRVRKEREERVQAEVRAMDQPSVYVIPISLSEDELHRPPRYSTVQFYEPPPAYHELNLKPEACPVEPPPAYSESISPSPSHS